MNIKKLLPILVCLLALARPCAGQVAQSLIKFHSPTAPDSVGVSLPAYSSSTEGLSFSPLYTTTNPAISIQHYQWQYSLDGGTTWKGPDGTSSTEYTAPSIGFTFTSGTLEVRCRAINPQQPTQGTSTWTTSSNQTFAAFPYLIGISGPTGVSWSISSGTATGSWSNESGYAFLYNNSGSTGAPSWQAIVNAALPNEAGDVTGNPGSTVVTAERGHTFKNAAPSDAQIFLWNNSNSDWEPESVSGDVSITNAGVATVTGINTKAISLGTIEQAPLVYTSQGNYAWGGTDRTYTTQSYTLGTSSATVNVLDSTPFKANNVVLFINGANFFSATVSSVTSSSITFTWQQNDGGTSTTVFGSGTLVRLVHVLVVTIGPFTSTPSTGGDIEEIELPNYLGNSVNYVGLTASIRAQTDSTSSSAGKVDVSTASGAFSAAQSSGSVSLGANNYQSLENVINLGGAVSSGNKLRWNWTSVGGSLNNIVVTLEVGF